MYKLLIADDEIVEREALEDVAGQLFGSQVELRLAENGRRAVELAIAFAPDIAMMDIKMPLLNGIDAARQIRERFPNCQIIMLTGFTYFNYARDSVSLGAVDFLVKPASDEAVETAIRAAMKKVDELRAHSATERLARRSAAQADRYLENELVSAIAFTDTEELPLLPMVRELYPDVTCGLAAVLHLRDADGASCSTALQRRCKELCVTAPARLGEAGLYLPACRRYGRVFLGVLSRRERSHEEYDAFFSALLEDLEREGVQAAFALSAPVHDLSRLPLAFCEARKAQPVGGTVVWFSPVPPGAERDSQTPLEQQLCACLEQKQYSDATLLLDRLLEAILADGVCVRPRVYELLVILNRAAARHTTVEATWPLWEHIETLPAGEPLRQFAINFLQNLTDRLILAETAENESWAVEVENYLKEEYRTNLTLEDAAGRVGFSTYYFSRMFRQKFGKTFVEYLTAIRMSRAKQLLADVNTSVKEVCFEVGYSEPNYFARVFKRETGLTPSDYQKKLQADLC